MIKIYGRKQDEHIIHKEDQKRLYLSWLLNIKDGTLIVSTHKIFRPHKTYQQVKTHFGLLINTVIVKANDEGIDTSRFLRMLVREDLPTGIGLTKDFVHQLLYALCPVYDEEGGRVTLSKMNTEQASFFLNMCRNLLAGRGIYIPDPNPNWKKK